MTAKITIERASPHTVRMTLTADIQISGSTSLLAGRGASRKAPVSGAGEVSQLELLTVEQTAELLQISRDKTHYLIRIGQLRSIKIGKLRRVSRAWIAELIDQLETGSTNPCP